jgi:hypothetical protein
MKQQLSITICSLPANKNKHPFSVFHLQQTSGSLPFPFSISRNQTEVVAVFC